MDTKTEILVQTFALTMKYGIKSVSMDDIARQLGMSKKTIYQHFENKKALVQHMVEMRIAEDEAEISVIIAESKDAIDEMVGIARHMLTFLRGMSPSLIYDMQKYYPAQWQMVDRHHHDFLYGIVQKNIERGKAEGLYLDRLNADVLARLYGNMCQCITDEDYFPLRDYSKSELYADLVSYHMRGIVSPKGLKLFVKQQNRLI